MTKIIASLFFAFFLLGFSSCSKDDQPEPEIPVGSSLNLTVDILAGSQEVVPGPTVYTTASGAQFKTDLLKFYLSNFRLLMADGSEYNAKTYKLIDFADPASQEFSLKNIPAGQYSGLKFMLGVDSIANHTLQSNEPDLDPSKGMVWSWSTGYIFFKHEGSYFDNDGVERNLLYHYGKSIAAVEITLPFGSTVTMSNKTSVDANLRIDLAKVYSTPQVIDFNVYNNNQSLIQADTSWLNALKGNFAQSFELNMP